MRVSPRHTQAQFLLMLPCRPALCWPADPFWRRRPRWLPPPSLPWHLRSAAAATAAAISTEAVETGAAAGGAAGATPSAPTAAAASLPYDLLVGADGSGSAVREALAACYPGQYDTQVP